MRKKIYEEMVGGNNFWTIYVTENRNRNVLEIHNNSEGKTFKSDWIYDSDILKLIRLLNEYKYSFIKFDDLIKKINSRCRHLKISRIIDLYYLECVK